jgi:hypothetical protein
MEAADFMVLSFLRQKNISSICPNPSRSASSNSLHLQLFVGNGWIIPSPPPSVCAATSFSPHRELNKKTHFEAKSPSPSPIFGSAQLAPSQISFSASFCAAVPLAAALLKGAIRRRKEGLLPFPCSIPSSAAILGISPGPNFSAPIRFSICRLP